MEDDAETEIKARIATTNWCDFASVSKVKWELGTEKEVENDELSVWEMENQQ